MYLWSLLLGGYLLTLPIVHKPDTLCVPHYMASKHDRFMVQLADSTSLIVDKRTPSGVYHLLGGRLLFLYGRQRYPRSYNICDIFP